MCTQTNAAQEESRRALVSDHGRPGYPAEASRQPRAPPDAGEERGDEERVDAKVKDAAEHGSCDEVLRVVEDGVPRRSGEVSGKVEMVAVLL
jgi:hypothetical protein